MYWNWNTHRRSRASAQRRNMQQAASGQPIQLREAFMGAVIPGGPGYGAVLRGRQVLVQPGARTSGAMAGGSINFAGQELYPQARGQDVIWVPRSGTQATQIERAFGIGAVDRLPANVPPAPILPPPEAAAAPAPAALGSRNVPIAASGGRGRAANLALQQAEQQVRMDGQYRSPDYWKSKEGAAMLQLAQQQSAPTGVPLADYYRAQRAAGIGNQAEIVAGLTSGLEGDKAKNMAAWAKANPMLSMREYNKRFPAGSPSQGPADAGGFDWATDAGQAVRAISEAEALKAGLRFVDASSLPVGEGVGFAPLPTSQAVAAADGAAGGGVRNTDQAVLAAIGAGALDGLRPGATSDDAILAGQAAGVFDSPSQAGGLVEDHLNRARSILRRGDRY